MTDAELAASIAADAGALLLQLRASGATTDLGTRGDQAANRLILAAIGRARPDDAILSEEAVDDHARLGQRRVWIVDPLDGTREYADGRDDWAVHVALAIDGVATHGAVALPARQLLLRSDQVTPLPAGHQPPIMVVSRSRPPAIAQVFARQIGATLLPMGSAGAKAMAVVRGEADIYLHSGGQSEWDSCAPVAVASAHGLHCSRLDGRALTYNQADVAIPDLLICRTEWADRILAAVDHI